jgi:hypothetical protein
MLPDEPLNATEPQKAQRQSVMMKWWKADNVNDQQGVRALKMAKNGQ